MVAAVVVVAVGGGVAILLAGSRGVGGRGSGSGWGGFAVVLVVEVAMEIALEELEELEELGELEGQEELEEDPLMVADKTPRTSTGRPKIRWTKPRGPKLGLSPFPSIYIYTLLTAPRWKKNYPFFILAFLVVTVPILFYAFAVPIRKWAKRQLVQNRPRRQSNMEELGTGAGGFMFPRSPGGSAVWAGGAPAAGSGGSFMGGAAGGGGGGAGSRHGSSTHALDGPSSSGVFATEVLPPPQQPPSPRDAQVSTRQESWERRVRAQFARGKSFRLKFWKKGEASEEG